jgi:translation initiation factor IF-2
VEEVVEVADKVIDKEEIFSLSRPTIEKGPVVIGSIDLNLLNQNTRPKPKTKEQKRKEREDKIKNERRPAVPAVAAVKVEGDDDPNKKKKRERFTNHKVDINKVQANNHEVKKHTPGTPSANPANNNSNAAANNAKKDRFKKPLKTVVNEEEVEKQIKETLARMAGGNKKNKGAKYRREKRDSDRARQEEQAQRERDQESVLKLTEFVTVSELASMMDVSVNQVIGTCMSIGMMVSINQRLDAETINIVAEEFVEYLFLCRQMRRKDRYI